MSTDPSPSASQKPSPPPRLLDQLRQSALKHFGRVEPAERHVEWARRYILFHDKRHPRDLNTEAAMAFLQHVALAEKDPLPCLEQAREAQLAMRIFHESRQFPLDERYSLTDQIRQASRSVSAWEGGEWTANGESSCVDAVKSRCVETERRPP
jgi:hypothetical protein